MKFMNKIKRIIIIVLPLVALFSSCTKKYVSDNESNEFWLVNPEYSNVKTMYSKEDPVTIRIGTSIGKVNSDNFLDLLFIKDNKLNIYINKGEFRFKHVDKLDIPIIGLNGASLIDVNGDGLSDLFLLYNNFSNDNQPNDDIILINNNGVFSFESQNNIKINANGRNSTYSFLDYDNDGDLDLYMANEPVDSSGESMLNKITSFELFKSFPSSKYSVDRFYENLGKEFIDVTEKVGLDNKINFCNSIICFDYNNDGFIDIYVANDFIGEDFLYENNGNKSFSSVQQNVINNMAMASMGCDVSDINNDGFQDLFVGEMLSKSNYRQKTNTLPFTYDYFDRFKENNFINQYQKNFFYLNDRGEHFKDISYITKTEATEWSWGVLFADFNCDGNEDLFVSNGFRFDWTNLDYLNNTYGSNAFSGDNNSIDVGGVLYDEKLSIQSSYSSVMFENKGEMKFEEVGEAWGVGFPANSYGSAYADLDNDGDLDIVVNNELTNPFIFENRTNILNPSFKYLHVEFEGLSNNFTGIGAKLFVYYNGRMRSYENTSFKGYFSNVYPCVKFGLPANTDMIDSMVVVWPGGKYSKLENVLPNQTIIFFESEAKSNFFNQGDEIFPKDSTMRRVIGNTRMFQHKESEFVDFKRDFTIERVFSRLGPKIAVGDVNGDNKEDFYVCGASGQSGAMYFQSDSGFIFAANQDMYDFILSEELDAEFFDFDNDGDLDLYIASGSNEFASLSKHQLDRIFVNDGNGVFRYEENILPRINTSTNAVSFSDYDMDGDIDVFVGGRISPEYYPKTPRSYLLINENGVFIDGSNLFAESLQEVGMVTESVWSDYDNDGDYDLILVGDWMGFTVFNNEKGVLTQKIHSLTNTTKGWWNTIEIIDYDNDGDDDYVLGNFGSNSFFNPKYDKPLTLFTNDFDKNGSQDPILFSYFDSVNAPFINRDLFCLKMPFFNNRFYNYDSYGKADIKSIFEDGMIMNSFKLQAINLKSIVVENVGEGNSFVCHELPWEAQLAPINSFVVNDFNNDGFPDILVAGNTYSNHYSFPPLVEHSGLILLNNQNKGFIVKQTGGFNRNKEIRDATTIFFQEEKCFILGINNDFIELVKILDM